MARILTDEIKIKELLRRGVEKIYPSQEFLEQRLKSGEELKIYLGIDPTGPDLHLGHSVQLLTLKRFEDLGHKTPGWDKFFLHPVLKALLFLFHQLKF